jgi:hypothetical protein
MPKLDTSALICGTPAQAPSKPAITSIGRARSSERRAEQDEGADADASGATAAPSQAASSAVDRRVCARAVMAGLLKRGKVRSQVGVARAGGFDVAALVRRASLRLAQR